MLKELLKNKRFNSAIREGLERKDVLDIILFGSVIRGKDEPDDIDLAVVYAFKDDADFNYSLRKKLEKEGFRVHVNGSSYADLFHPSFFAREGILLEGYSFKLKKFLSSAFSFSSFILFKYYLGGMNNSDRMKFYYALYGRGNEKGVMETFSCYKISDKLIIAPIENADKISEFLEIRKIKFDKIPILIPGRLGSKRFLEEQ